MGRIYTRIYSTHYEDIPNAGPPLSVTGTKKTSFEIPFPSEGYIEKLVVYQASGSSTNFEVELLNSQIPFPPGDYDLTDAPADNLEPYRIPLPITAAQSATAGNVITLTDDDFGFGFRNIDGAFTSNIRKVYLLIKPAAASGTSTWNVFLQCRTDIG